MNEAAEKYGMNYPDQAGLENFDFKRFDAALFDLAKSSEPFSGERYTPGSGVQICYEHMHRYLFALRHMSAEDIVLDLGCGLGYGALLMAERAAQVIALDIDPKSTSLLQSVAKSHAYRNLSVLTGDIAQLETLLASCKSAITIVTCHEVIEHVTADVQANLLSLVASGKHPFAQKLKLFVSTPDKLLYEQTRTEPNPYHQRELSLDEFRELLKKSFQNVQLFEQSTCAANCLTSLDGSQGATGTLFQLGWQSADLLVPGLSPAAAPPAEYIYAVASNSVLPTLERTSALLDSSNQYVRERLSIAAHELRLKEERLRLLDEIAGQICRDLNLNSLAELRPISEEIAALRELSIRQAEKIRAAERQHERIGTDRAKELTLLNEMVLKVHALDAQVNGLKPWHAMAGTLLGPTPEDCAKEVHRLRAVEAALRTPAHRAVTVLGKLARAVLPLRLIKRMALFFGALVKA